jgi:hypothetical protein
MATATELAAVEAGGLISEDVFPRLFNLTPVERPFIDSVGSTSAKNYKKEFTDKVLAQPSSTNTLYENQDLSGVDDSRHGLRYYNLCQQMGKVIKTSQRGRDVKLTYDADEFLQQLMDAGEELRMDEEAAAVSRNAATAEIPGVSGALMAGACTWAAIASNVTDGLASLGGGGVSSILDGSTNVGGGPTTAANAGTKRALTEDMFRGVLRAGWEQGARFTHAMAIGDLIENIGNYLFTSSARVATFTSDVPQSNRTGATSGNGARQGGVVAQGAVNMFVGNFGVVTLTPNRQMEPYGAADDSADLLFLDPRYPMMATLHDYATKEIAQVGLYDQQVMYCDKTMIPGATRSLGLIADIDFAAPMTAS